MKTQKGFSSSVVILIGVIAVIIVGGGYYVIQQSSTEVVMTEVMTEEEGQNDVMEKKDNAMMEDDAMMMEEDKQVMSEEDPNAPRTTPWIDELDVKTYLKIKYGNRLLAGTQSLLLDFTKEDYETAVTSDKLVVLYFYANWCPICKAEFPKMQAAFDELTTDRVIGFRVNYNDNETDEDEKALARRFGVAYQHTKVFLKNGERILKSPEGWNKNRYLSEISTALEQ